MQRLAFFASRDVPDLDRWVYVVHAGPYSTIGIASSEQTLVAGQRWCPFPFALRLTFQDPAPLELREALRGILEPTRVSGDSWFDRERVEAFACAVESMPRAERPPALPELPERCTRFVRDHRAKERQLADAVGWIRSAS